MRQAKGGIVKSEVCHARELALRTEKVVQTFKREGLVIFLDTKSQRAMKHILLQKSDMEDEIQAIRLAYPVEFLRVL